MTNLAPEILVKHPTEIRAIAVLFGEKLDPEDTITAASLTIDDGPDADLLFSAPVVNAAADVIRGQYRRVGSVVNFTASGGTDGGTYLARCNASTANGENLVGLFTVIVDDEVE